MGQQKSGVCGKTHASKTEQKQFATKCSKQAGKLGGSEGANICKRVWILLLSEGCD